ncbi:YajQ family cyclic di-GMP-binding protein [Methyloparacoccus murrellii]
MPSFDVVSEVDLHEVANAVDQANREVGTRFDFKGTAARFELKDAVITLLAENEFQLQQMMDILQPRLAKRGVDLLCLKVDPPQVSGRQARQTTTLRQGIETALAKRIVKLVKDSRMKVQAAIQGDQVRISGKQRDDLQEAMALLRRTELDMPLQFINFRD